MKPQDLFLGFMMGICFYLSASRLYDFVSGSTPPGKVGECLLLHYPDQEAEVKIVSNDRKEKSSVIMYRVYGEVWFQEKISFADLRELKAKRVNCHE